MFLVRETSATGKGEVMSVDVLVYIMRWEIISIFLGVIIAVLTVHYFETRNRERT